jgi:hypothetical protein
MPSGIQQNSALAGNSSKVARGIAATGMVPSLCQGSSLPPNGVSHGIERMPRCCALAVVMAHLSCSPRLDVVSYRARLRDRLKWRDHRDGSSPASTDRSSLLDHPLFSVTRVAEQAVAAQASSGPPHRWDLLAKRVRHLPPWKERDGVARAAVADLMRRIKFLVEQRPARA